VHLLASEAITPLPYLDNKRLEPYAIGKKKVTRVQAMQHIEGEDIQLYSSLNSALNREVNITPRPLYPRKEPRYPLNWGLCRLQNRSGPFSEEKKNLLPCLDFDHWIIQSVAYTLYYRHYTGFPL
jgi:hypothetical protein